MAHLVWYCAINLSPCYIRTMLTRTFFPFNFIEFRAFAVSLALLAGIATTA